MNQPKTSLETVLSGLAPKHPFVPPQHSPLPDPLPSIPWVMSLGPKPPDYDLLPRDQQLALRKAASDTPTERLQQAGLAILDAAVTPLRLMTDISGGIWGLAGDALGDTQVGQYAKAQAKYAEGISNKLNFSPETRAYTDAAWRGLIAGGVFGKLLVGPVLTWGRPHLPKALNLTKQAFHNVLARHSAFAASAGEVVLQGAIDTTLEPWLATTDYSEEAKNALRMGAWMLGGLVTGLTVENAIDVLTKNPAVFLGRYAEKAVPKDQHDPVATQLSFEEQLSRDVQGNTEALLDLARIMNLPPEDLSNIEKASRNVREYWDDLANARKAALGTVEYDDVKAWYEGGGFERAIARYEMDDPTTWDMAPRNVIESTEINDQWIWLKFTETPDDWVLAKLKEHPTDRFHWFKGRWRAPNKPWARDLIKYLNEKAGQLPTKNWLSSSQNILKVEEEGLLKAIEHKEGKISVALKDKPNALELRNLKKTLGPGFKWDRPSQSWVSSDTPKNREAAEQARLLLAKMKGEEKAAVPEEPGVAIPEEPTVAISEKPTVEERLRKTKLPIKPREVPSYVKVAGFTPVQREGRFVVTLKDPARDVNYTERLFVGPTYQWIGNDVLAAEYPLVKTFMDRFAQTGMSKSINEGFTTADIVNNIRQAYNHFRPGDTWSDADIDQHMAVLRQFEDLMDELRQTFVPKDVLKQGETSQWVAQLWKLNQQKLLTNKQFFAAGEIIKNLARNADFALEYVETGTGAFSFLTNTIHINTPEQLFHEVSHWAWYHILTKQDRLGFTEEILRNYRTSQDWNRLWPARAVLQEAGTVSPTIDWITELYADLGRQYIHTYRLPAIESAGILRKMVQSAKEVFKSIRNSGYEMPVPVRRYVEKIMSAPNPPKVKLYSEYDDLIQRFYLYRDKESFVKAESGAVSAEQAVRFSNWAHTLMKGDRTAIETLSQENLGIEDVLQQTHRNIMSWWHFQTGDLKQLDLIMGRLAEMFLLENKAAVLPLTKSKNHYTDLRQFFNDLGVMYSWMRTRMNVRKPEPIKLSQEYFSLLQKRLLDEAGTPGEKADVLDYNPFRDWNPYDARWVQLRFWPQAISAMMGLETDSDSGVPVPFTDIYLNWSPEKWLTTGYGIGPLLSSYSLFGTGLRRAGSKGLSNLWQKLEKVDPPLADYINLKAQGVSKHWLVRAFRTREGLTGELANIRKGLFDDPLKIQRQIRALANQYNQMFTRDEQLAISELVEQQGHFDVSSAREEVRRAAEEVIELKRRIRKDLIDAGYSKEILDLYGDRYLHRVFGKKALQWYAQGGAARKINREWMTLDARFMKLRGYNVTLRGNDPARQELFKATPDLKVGDVVYDYGKGDNRRWFSSRAQRKLDQLEDEGIDKQHTWRVVKLNPKTKTVVLNRDYTKLEGDAYGEVREIAPRLHEYARMVGHAVAVGRAIQRIAANKQLVFDPEQLKKAPKEVQEDLSEALLRARERGWVQVPNTEVAPGIKRYGALAGKWVDPEAMYALRTFTYIGPESEKLRKPFMYYRDIIRAWKIGNTAYNPTTHGRNFMHNLHMCVLDGRSPAHVLLSGIKHVVLKDKVFQQAIDAGLLDSNIMRAEFDLGDFIDEVSDATGRTMLEQSDNLMTAYLKHWAKDVARTAVSPGRVAKKVAIAPMRLYELGDEVFKLGVFSQEVARGADPVTALAKAEEIFFNYRDVPIGVRFLRDWGIIPFITFTYKLLPVLFKSIRDQPHRLIGIVAAYEMFNNMMLQAEFEDEYELVKEHSHRTFPDWMGRRPYIIGPKGAVFTGVHTNELGVRYDSWLEYGSFLPGGDALSIRGLTGGFPFGMNPFMSSFYGLITNRDPYFEDLIVKHPESLSDLMKRENREEVMKFLLRVWLPEVPLYPGAFSLDRLGNAFTAQGLVPKNIANEMGWTGKDYWGTDHSVSFETLNWLGLYRRRRHYPIHETAHRLDALRYDIKQTENRFGKVVADFRSSQEEKAAMKRVYQDVAVSNIAAMKEVAASFSRSEQIRAQAQRARAIKQIADDPRVSLDDFVTALGVYVQNANINLDDPESLARITKLYSRAQKARALHQ